LKWPLSIFAPLHTERNPTLCVHCRTISLISHVKRQVVPRRRHCTSYSTFAIIPCSVTFSSTWQVLLKVTLQGMMAKVEYEVLWHRSAANIGGAWKTPNLGQCSNLAFIIRWCFCQRGYVITSIYLSVCLSIERIVWNLVVLWWTTLWRYIRCLLFAYHKKRIIHFLSASYSAFLSLQCSIKYFWVIFRLIG